MHVHTAAKTMKLHNAVKPPVLVLSVELWTMQSRTAHNFRIKVIGISNRDKQLLGIRHELRTKLDNLSGNNNKANSKHITRMLVLHSSNKLEMHKGGRIGHSSKGGHTI